MTFTHLTDFELTSLLDASKIVVDGVKNRPGWEAMTKRTETLVEALEAEKKRRGLA